MNKNEVEDYEDELRFKLSKKNINDSIFNITIPLESSEQLR